MFQKSFPQLNVRLERLDTEYEDAILRLQRLETAISARFYKDPTPCPALHMTTLPDYIRNPSGLSAAMKGKLPPTSANNKTGSDRKVQYGGANETFLKVIDPDDLRVLLRETTFSAHNAHYINRFLTFLYWLPYTHRYYIASRAAAILRQSKTTPRIQTDLVDGPSDFFEPAPSPHRPLHDSDGVSGSVDLSLSLSLPDRTPEEISEQLSSEALNSLPDMLGLHLQIFLIIKSDFS